MFIPFRQYSTFSILKAIGQPEDIISSFANYEYPAASLTEFNNVFSAVKLFSACKSSKIRPILGTDLRIKDSQGKTYNILCHAKNLNGWKGILKAISKASEPDYEEGLTLEMAAGFFGGNVLVSTGSLYSELGLNIFTEYEKHLCGISYDQSKALVNPDWKKNTLLLFNSYKDLFGKDNVIAEICLSEKDYIPATEIISKIVKSLLKEIGCKAIYTTNSHYTNKQDAEIHRILLSSSLKTTLVDFESEAKKTGNYNLLPFYKSSKAYVLSPDEIKSLYNESELKSNFEVLDLIEKYDILSNPQLPPYPIPPDSKSTESNAYLRELCLKGWSEKIKKVIPEKDHGRYADRVKYELKVIAEANLSDYFLIVQDIMNWARSRFLCGPARGSAAGSIVAYLTNITEVDPIEYGLLFERFYNAGRNSPGKISYPDIDSDFPVERREDVKKFIIERWGQDRVGNITTFGKLKGKAALKEVLRIKQRCSTAEMNKITSFIPDEGKISDKLREMEEQEGESSIIKWALENSTSFNEWVKLKDGKLEGPFSIDFQQAIAIEGCVKSHGTHAGGVVIGRYPLVENCPLLHDGEKRKVGFDMGDCEKIGHLKMDILGVKAIDDVDLTSALMNGEE